MTSIAEPNGASGSVPTTPSFGAGSAGAMIREARQARGLDVAWVAAALKVPPRKLEMLEADRYEELLDPAFARALAKSVCRHLKIDAEPVLARLPQGAGHRLERLGDRLNTPLREYGESRGRTLLRSPAVWIALLLVAGAVAVMLLPIDVERVRRWVTASEPASTPAAERAPSVVVETVPHTPGEAAAPIAAVPASPAVAPEPAAPPEPAPAASQPPAAAVSGGVASAPSGSAEAVALASLNPLVVQARARAWLEVQDANKRVLIARDLQPGETVGLDGPPPLRVRLGNATAATLTYRGQVVNLKSVTRGNIAQLELK